MEGRKILFYLSQKYKGNWDKIYKAVQNREDVKEEDIEKALVEEKYPFITILDNEYPEWLKQTYKPPFVLYYEGNLKILRDKNYSKVALSDSRHVSKAQKDIAMNIVNSISNSTLIIGGEGELTESIINDTNNPIIMVLGYDIGHYGYEGLKQKIKARGGIIITEYPSNSFVELSNDNFMGRYRIMTALADKVVIPCGVKNRSGSMLLISHALTLGKEIFVVPTSLAEKDYINNQLIYEGAVPIYTIDSGMFS